MNRQEIFKRVAQHLINQSAKAEHNGTCRYRATNGGVRKCAIGCLILDNVYEKYNRKPDEERGSYDNKLEGQPVDCEIVQKALKQSGVDLEEGDDYFLQELQSIHDHSPVALWGVKLKKFATTRKLKLPYPFG